MGSDFACVLTALQEQGWTGELEAECRLLPEGIQHRYAWLPEDVVDFIQHIKSLVSPDQTSWFLTSAEIWGIHDSAFRWNQWELDSLAAAQADPVWSAEIKQFWDRHFPLTISVGDQYRYLAVSQAELSIVGGTEPEFEETEPVAKDFAELLQNLIQQNPINYLS